MAAFNERKPQAVAANGGLGVSTEMDATRANLIYLRESLVAMGAMPGYDVGSGDITYNADGTVATILYKEQTAMATANGRTSTTRCWVRLTFTYTTGSLTKVRYEISANGGSGAPTYSNWVDAAGNAYNNLTYNADGTLATSVWATS